MANKPLTTTVIGSFPKPSYLPIEDWFNSARNDGGMDTERVTKEFTQYIEKKSDSDEHLFVRAAKDVINLQIDAGIVSQLMEKSDEKTISTITADI